MDLTFIAIFSLTALVVGQFSKGRNWLLLMSSILAVYAVQPATPIRGLDYWLPTLTLGLTILVWAVNRQVGEDYQKQDFYTLAVVAGAVLLIGLNRYIEPICCLTPSRPPVWPQVAVGLAVLALLVVCFMRWGIGSKWGPVGFIVVLLTLFIVLKSPSLAQAASAVLRRLTGQQAALASALDIRWLGFSYVAFRLIHTLRDRMAGRLASVTLQEMIIYVIFFPAFSAGPIDRLPRFTQDLRKPFKLGWEGFWNGGQRIGLGIFKKFVLADSLALASLNDVNAGQVAHSGWLWVLVYIYALRLYFDFSGYTDIAVGLGQWMGFKLPENFDHPYLKPNLTQFWNSWHITLAQWFRAYFFNPLTRWLRSRPEPIPMWAVILVGQVGTMLLIGLWHGLNWNFVLWGLWHAAGLFIHNRWNELVQPRLQPLTAKPWAAAVLAGAGTLLTFHYVTLGWVWFALSSPSLSWNSLLLLAGVR